MTAQMVWQAIQRVPWAAVLFQVETAVFCLLVWGLTTARLNRGWLRWAPAKAQVRIRGLTRKLKKAIRIIQRLHAELAEARGQIAAGKQGLEKPEQAPLLYARGRWGKG